jgi:penicillin-binding protein 1A
MYNEGMAGMRDQPGGSGQRQFLKKILAVFIFIAAVIGFLGGFLYWTVSDLPSVKILEEYAPLESSRVFSCDGQLIAELFVERRTYIPYYEIPDHVKKAFISVEDIRFYQHPGVDMIGILRALWSDIKAGSVVEGGSTITQQLARMMFLTPERSLTRKIKESALSIKIERHYTKDEILGMYLNQAYFGTRAYGIEAAAQTYFGSTTRNLGIAEAALLASLPKAPSLYSPFKNPAKAGERRAVVLRRMRENNFIKDAQVAEAARVPLPETPHFRKYEAPYFIETLRQQLEGKYGNSLYISGYNIYSTIDFSMQQAAEDAVSHGIASLEKRVAPGVEAALIAIDVRTGHVKALVGGVDFWMNQFNRATQALRQPGSAFKPFVYATAIQHGMIATDMVEDAPLSFKGAGPGQVWSPRNYDGEYHGKVTLQKALAKSLNCATVRLASKVGLRSVIDTARKLGIRSRLHPYFPLALGASDVTLIDMVSAYSAFVSGYRPEPVFYERISNRNDVVLEEKVPALEKVLYTEDVEQIRILMRAVIEEGTGQGAKVLGREVFGKTGTTNDYTDAWFVGFDERMAVGVWVGRDNHKPIGPRETGARAALPVWIEFMRKVPQQTPTVQSP